MDVTHQLGIDEHGEMVSKDRLTHDQSFSLGFCPSVNALIDQSQLIDPTMGHCLSCIFHQIIRLRLEFPQSRILICKIDWASAYRRINGDGAVAARSITINTSNKFAHVAIQLTFGATANPAEFSIIPETCTDLCNDLVDCDAWQPDLCSSPLQSDIGPPIRLDDNIPIQRARELAVNVPARPKAFTTSTLMT